MCVRILFLFSAMKPCTCVASVMHMFIHFITYFVIFLCCRNLCAVPPAHRSLRWHCHPRRPARFYRTAVHPMSMVIQSSIQGEFNSAPFSLDLVFVWARMFLLATQSMVLLYTTDAYIAANQQMHAPHVTWKKMHAKLLLDICQNEKNQYNWCKQGPSKEGWRNVY